MGALSQYYCLQCVALVAVAALGATFSLAARAQAPSSATRATRTGVEGLPATGKMEQVAESVGLALNQWEILSARVEELEATTSSAIERIDGIQAELAQLREESERDRRSLAVELEELNRIVSRIDSESESTASALRARIEAGLGEVIAEGKAGRQALDDEVRGVAREVDLLRTRAIAVSNSLTAAEERILEEQDQRRSGDKRNATQAGIAVGLLLVGVGVAWWSSRSRVAKLDSRIQWIQPEMEDRIDKAREEIAAGVRKENGELLSHQLRPLEEITAMLESIRSLTGAGPPEAENHDLPLGVCNELNRIENNLLAMDSTVRGHKQVSACVRRVKENLRAHGYEITELRGRPYDGGMLVEADFVSDEGLPSGDRIITRVSRPEVRFGGTIVQNASVKVSVGL